MNLIELSHSFHSYDFFMNDSKTKNPQDLDHWVNLCMCSVPAVGGAVSLVRCSIQASFPRLSPGPVWASLHVACIRLLFRSVTLTEGQSVLWSSASAYFRFSGRSSFRGFHRSVRTWYQRKDELVKEEIFICTRRGATFVLHRVSTNKYRRGVFC